MPGEFLPPDPFAAGAPAPRPPAARIAPAAAPAELASPAPVADAIVPAARSASSEAVPALALGVAALAVLVYWVGELFFLTLPCSLAAWMLGSRAKARAPQDTHATVAVLLGIVGAALAVIAGAAYIALGAGE